MEKMGVVKGMACITFLPHESSSYFFGQQPCLKVIYKDVIQFSFALGGAKGLIGL